jgi:hypothetical protein
MEAAWLGPKPRGSLQSLITLEGIPIPVTIDESTDTFSRHAETLKETFKAFLSDQRIRNRFPQALGSDQNIETIVEHTVDSLEPNLRATWDTLGSCAQGDNKWRTFLPVLQSTLCYNNRKDWTPLFMAGLGLKDVHDGGTSHTALLTFPQTYMLDDAWFVSGFSGAPQPKVESNDQGGSSVGLPVQSHDAEDNSPFSQSKQEETSSAPGANDTDDSDDCVDAEGLELHRCASRS